MSDQRAADQSYMEWAAKNLRQAPDGATRAAFAAGHQSRDGEVAVLRDQLAKLDGLSEAQDLAIASLTRPIPCSERPPPPDPEVPTSSIGCLIFTDGEWEMASYHFQAKRWDDYSHGWVQTLVTHWLPLPPAPESRAP